MPSNHGTDLKVTPMNRLSLFSLILVSLTLPITAIVQAQNVTGLSIEEVAASVVLIETIEGRDGIATGSGTIISPDGIIYTNCHVIEYGNDFAIYMLDDIREQPVLCNVDILEPELFTFQ
jgi:S1-C subfamily serine protease